LRAEIFDDSGVRGKNMAWPRSWSQEMVRFETPLSDPHPESAKTYPQTVFCTQHQRVAEIVVANWPHSEEGWSNWRMIDCSLLPPGAVRCGMDSLSQAKVKSE